MRLFQFLGVALTFGCMLRPYAAVLLALGALLPVARAQAPEFPHWVHAQESTRDLVGEQHSQAIDPYTGDLKLSYRDVHVPGNGGLDLTVYRVYDTATMSYGASGTDFSHSAHSLSYKWVGMGLGWSLSVAPKVVIYPRPEVGKSLPLAANEDRLCGGRGLSPIYMLEQADGSVEPLIPVASGVGQTASNWRLTCDSLTGPYRLYSPGGLRYDLGLSDSVAGHMPFWALSKYHRPVTVRYATKVTDSNGNWMEFAYQRFGVNLWVEDTLQLWAAYLPTRVATSDGRSLGGFKSEAQQPV